MNKNLIYDVNPKLIWGQDRLNLYNVRNLKYKIIDNYLGIDNLCL